jgi:nucleoside-diphosphate-sugar epimerase
MVNPGAHCLILGCGRLGLRTAALLLERGWRVTGVRRTPGTDAPCPLIAADAADPAQVAALPEADAVLFAATPGLRRGRDNRLAEAAALVVRRWPRARLVGVSTTAVYADRAGADADEHAPLALDDPAVAGLVAIEQALLLHPDCLVLRMAALVGPERRHASERIRAAAGAPLTVAGDIERPFAYLHDQDAAELCALTVTGALGRGLLNAAAPTLLTVAGYYRLLAGRLGLPLDLRGDGRPAPRRAVDARRLHALLGERAWLAP